MPFVKLDCNILKSTIWFNRNERDVFITALLMAEPYETREPVPQLEVDSLSETGFVVPPGWYGFVPSAGVGIVHQAQVPREDGMQALRVLGMPEADSRSQEWEGRRVVRVNGGFIVLNYMKYRDRDYTSAERQARFRERVKKQRDVTQSNAEIVTSPRNITQAEAEAEVQAEVPLATLAVSRARKKPLGYRPRIDVAWPGRPPVPSSLHADFIGKLGGEDADARLMAWYPEASAAYEDQPIGDDDFTFWRARFREWVGTTKKPARTSAAPQPDYPDEWACHHEPVCPNRDWHEMKLAEAK